MSIIERYVMREILIPFMAAIIILAGIFTSFNSARILSGAVISSLGFVPIITFLMLKTLIALEVLIPVALYIAVIIGLSRLSKDQEILALHAVGISRNRIIYIVLMIAIPIGIISGILSVYARPWAYAESYILNAQAEAELNMRQFQEKRFYGREASGRVVYFQSKDADNRRIENIFHYVRKANNSEIVIARVAWQPPLMPHQQPQIHLDEGYIYQLSHAAEIDTMIKFEKMTYFLNSNETTNYRRQTASVKQLWESDKSPDIAELQWRLSRPVATILLALIAALFIRTAPRQDVGNRTYFIAAIVFAIYYYLSSVAQIWVEHGMISSFPGIWWLYLLILMFIGLLLSESIRVKLFRQ